MEKLFNKVFKVIDNGPTERSSIEIIDGPFIGLKYFYGEISFTEEPDICTMHFTYQILSNPSVCPPEGEDFNRLIGDILREVLDMQVEANAMIEEYRNSHASDPLF